MHNKFYIDYSAISENFSSARKKPWKEFDFLFNNAQERVLDLGCGNGRFYEKLCKTNYSGIDSSFKLIEIAKKNYPNVDFQEASAFEIPFKGKEFDCVYSLAVLHHFSLEEQKKFLKEVWRVLKKGGRLVITVWNLSERKKGDEKEILLPWYGIEKQFFYIFDLKELEELFKDFKIMDKGEIKVKNFSNYYLILKK